MSHDAASDTYQQHILDHYRTPRNFGVLDPADIDHTGDNPLCGDELRLTATVTDHTLTNVHFTGHGCAISQAAASMLTEHVKGQPLTQVKDMTQDDVLDMLGVPVTQLRIKCAVLSLAILKDGINAWEGE